MLEHEDLTSQIIAAAIAVHRALGPGFLESVYEESLATEFDQLGLSYERQKPVEVCYRGRRVGEHRLDFVVEGAVYVELKAIHDIPDVQFAIVRSGLKAAGLEHALLFNFATMPLTIKRVGREDPARKALSKRPPIREFVIS